MKVDEEKTQDGDHKDEHMEGEAWAQNFQALAFRATFLDQPLEPIEN